MLTPWGNSTSVEKIAVGIKFISTESHGGFWISDKRKQGMSKKYKHIPTFVGKFNLNKNMGGHWYEEDCDWCIVYLAFEDIFKEYDGNEFENKLIHARETFLRHFESKE